MLGSTRLVLIDGPAGSGKTTLAGALGEALSAQVLHGDDMYEGWNGLGTLWETLGEQVLLPLAQGRSGRFRRWDWVASSRGDVIDVPRARALVIEGVGVAQRRGREFANLVVYIDAPWEERLRRGLARDGEHMRSEWERWQAAEVPFLEREGTRAAAHYDVDGTEPIFQ